MAASNDAIFARKIGKQGGGILFLEAAQAWGGFDNEDIPEDVVPEGLKDKLVMLVGYSVYKPGKARRTGQEGQTVKTSYVTGLAVHDNHLYVITADKVYVAAGPDVPEIITGNAVLNEMWTDVKRKILSKKA